MFLTKECDYGVRVIRALADGTKKTVKTVATEEKIPEKFAHKIIRKLERASYVESIRGRNGGYALRKPISTLTLADIIAAVDSERYVIDCICENTICALRTYKNRPCTIRQELVRVQDMIMTALSSKTMDVVLNMDNAS